VQNEIWKHQGNGAKAAVTLGPGTDGPILLMALPRLPGAKGRTAGVRARDPVADQSASSLPKLNAKPNFKNPSKSPGSGWQWRGSGQPGTSKGNWYNPSTGEYLHPDLGHPGPIGPHYDWRAPDGTMYRVYSDGTTVPK
jgi:hypothetical protein